MSNRHREIYLFYCVVVKVITKRKILKYQSTIPLYGLCSNGGMKIKDNFSDGFITN